jgi:hypothetical protein
MAMEKYRRLVEHYDQKYRQSNSAQVKPISLVFRSRDCFEVTGE